MAKLKPMKTMYDNAVSQAIYSTWRTQTEAAKAIGISQASLCLWIKSGQVPIEKLEAFVRKTGVRPATVSRLYKQLSGMTA